MIAALAALAIAAVAAPAAQAREFEGVIVSRNDEKMTFVIQDDEGGPFKIKVTRKTEFEDVAGFSDITVGRTDLEVIAQKRDGRWIALLVETRGHSGSSG
jgi:hypothetical protein